MIQAVDRARERRRIHTRIRRKVGGTPERPRLAVYRTLKHIYAQVVDDRSGRTLVAASSVDSIALVQQRTVITRIVGVSVTAIADDGATASVTAEQLRRDIDPASGRPVETRVVQHVACRLVLDGGRWLVTEFRLLSEEPAGTTSQN